jgi:hypothetical protein
MDEDESRQVEVRVVGEKSKQTITSSGDNKPEITKRTQSLQKLSLKRVHKQRSKRSSSASVRSSNQSKSQSLSSS